MSGTITVYKPDGGVLLSGAAFSFIDTVTFPMTGTYAALVDPSGTQTGSISFTAVYTPDPTAALTDGNQSSLSTTIMGQNIRATFAGTSGQRVSVRTLTMQSCTVYLLDPHNANVATPVTIPNNLGGVFFDTTVLPITGTYTVLVDFPGNTTGSAGITYWTVPPDVTGPIVQGGSPVTAALGTPGQKANLTFTGTAGERLALTISNATISAYTLKVNKPDGSVLVSTSQGTTFLETGALPVAGQYSIFVQPFGAYTGNITLSLVDTPEVTGTLALDGTALQLTTTIAGQNVRGNFSGMSGHRVSYVVFSSLSSTIYLVKPDGSNLNTTTLPAGWGGVFIEPVVLPVGGAYSVLVDIGGTATGSVTMSAWDVPADVLGTLTAGGSPVTVAIVAGGQNGAFTFSGASGQQVTVRITSNTINPVTVKLLKPDGSVLTSTQSESSSFNLATQTLPTTGTYTIVIDPSAEKTGSLSVSVTSP